MIKNFYIWFSLLLLILPDLYSQWTLQSSGTTNLLTNVFFINQNTGTCIGISGTVKKTTNGGTGWTSQTVVNEHLYGIYYVDASTGYICGDGGYITKTTNGGNSWATQSPPVELYRGLYFFDASTGFACGSTGTIAKTTDGGASWTSLNSGVTVLLQNIKFADNSTGYVTGFSGTVLKTTNAGSNWIPLNTGSSELFFGLAVINANLVYVSGENGKFIKTTDGGNTWQNLNSGIVNRGVNLFFSDANTGTAACLNNIILKTTNGGSTWLQQPSGLSGQDLMGVWFTSPLTGYVTGSNGNILQTTTGGFPVPAAPVLISPVNGATGVSLAPLLDWDTVASAKTYQIQLGTDSNFTTPLLDSSNITGSQINVPSGLLTNNTVYYWHVRASNAGATGSWSPAFRFRTIVSLPLAPNLLLPVNGASNVSLTPTFDWDSTSPANYYTIQASLDTSFTNNQIFSTGIDRSFFTQTTPLFPNFRYYWRVNATNDAGTGAWSAVFNFITQTGPPAAPVLLYPANGAIGIGLTPTLDWVEDFSVTTYQTQLSQDSLFNTTLIDSTGFTASQLTVRSGLLTNVATYFWRVRTTNTLGTSAWSETWKFFTLLSAPNVPNLIAPPNNSVDISTTPTLDWDNVPFAETYRVQLSTDSTFAASLINLPVTVSQYNIPGGVLSNNTRYFWRVNASNQAGTSQYSVVWNFRTVTTPPVAAPTLLSPPNGAINLSLTPTLDWNDVFNTDGYKVLVSVDSFFNTSIIDTTITPSQFVIPSGRLSGSTTYYWRVRGFNIGGLGPWSVTWRFRTGPIGISQIGTEIPREYMLYNNYPNPFNPVTKIKFDLPKSSNVRIEIYDLTGRLVTMLVDESLEAGRYETEWNSSSVSSGVYIYRMSSRDFVMTKKMIVIK